MDLATFDPASPEVHRCPFPWYAALREDAPVYREPRTGWWFVTRWQDIRTAFASPDVLSSRVGKVLRPAQDADLGKRIEEIRAAGWPEVPVLVNEDAPRHKQQRKLVQQAFTARRIRALQDDIDSTVREVADRLPVGREFDFVADYAVPVPVLLIAKALGVPPERMDDFKRWSDNRVRMIGSTLSREDHLEIARSEVERQQWFAAAFAERRAQPQDDLMTDLALARLDEDGATLSDEELLSIVGQVLAAGNESTTKVLTYLVYQLAQRQDLWEWLREDPAGRAPAVVEEGLRLASPFQILLRLSTDEVEIGGVTIPPDQIVALVTASGCRDETTFPDPDEFDPHRTNTRDHLAFGFGLHFCIGAHLARTEAIAAITDLASRYQTLKLGEGNTFEYESSFIIRGLRRLEVTVG
ncbi:cytochrome P450 [Nocardia miyunensis]|uniref:cytochrome P450 n=1 Tax=Nocardia miyunensis TaxID=282684 RepID=UPI00082F4B78|nr:cytochrome P450 [Nocardia miyunensis]